MRDGNYLDEIVNLSKNDAVGELSEDVASGIPFKPWPYPRALSDKLDAVVYLGQEGLRSRQTPFEVPIERFVELSTGLGKVLNPGGAHSASQRGGHERPTKESSQPPRNRSQRRDS